jgi:hypothetical protein
MADSGLSGIGSNLVQSAMIDLRGRASDVRHGSGRQSVPPPFEARLRSHLRVTGKRVVLGYNLEDLRRARCAQPQPACGAFAPAEATVTDDA